MSYKYDQHKLDEIQQKLYDKKNKYKEIDDKVTYIENRIRNLNLLENNQFNRFINNKQQIKKKIDIDNYKIQQDEMKTLNKINRIKKYQQDYQRAQNSRLKLKQQITENLELNKEVKRQQAKKIALEGKFLQLKQAGNQEEYQCEKTLRAQIIKEGNIQSQEKLKQFWAARLDSYKQQKKNQIVYFTTLQQKQTKKFNFLMQQKFQVNKQFEKIKNQQLCSKYYLNQSQGMKFIKENFEIDKLAYSFASTQNNP